MSRYLFRRTLEAIPTLIGTSVLIFALIHFIPGDVTSAILGERATEEAAARIRTLYGLDKPLTEQYFIWVGNLARGDFGETIRGGIPISLELSRRFPATAELSLIALFLATLIGVPIGIISSINRNSLLDAAAMFGALLGVSIPIFVLGLLLIFIFGVELGWVDFVGRIDNDISIPPITGFYLIDALLQGNTRGLANAAGHLILPALTLMTVPLATTARITRSTMLEVLGQDYIRTAHAKGLSRRAVIVGHGLRSAMLPIITIIGLQMGGLLSGAVLTETIFAWPGVGKWLFDSIVARDYPIVQSVTFLVAGIYIMVNYMVDIFYAFADPRVRISAS